MLGTKFEEIVKNGLECSELDLTMDYLEMGLDSFIENEFVKEIPVIKSIFGILRGGLKIREIHFAKKFLVFLKQYHGSQLSEVKKSEFVKKFNSDIKYRNSVVELLIVINERFIYAEKSKLLGNLFAAHVNECINWNEFTTLSSCLEKLELSSITLFKELECENNKLCNDFIAPGNVNGAFLISSGLAHQWGNHIFITAYGKLFYIYGIKCNFDCNKSSILNKNDIKQI